MCSPPNPENKRFLLVNQLVVLGFNRFSKVDVLKVHVPVFLEI